MSLYNTLNGVNFATFFILPMLDKHPDEYPRFAISSLEEAYEDAIHNISESIKNGYINKEYLKK